MGMLLTLFAVSVIGTGLWLLLLALRPVTERLFSQTWHYYVGLIPLFFLFGGAGLVVQLVQAAQSALSFGGASTAAATALPAATAPMADTLQTAVNNEPVQLLINDVASRLDVGAAAPYLAGLWALGLIAFAAVQIIYYFQFKNRLFAGSAVVDAAQSPVKVIQSPAVATPMLFGIFQPVIVLPAFELSEKALDVILSHELLHKKRGDLLIKLCVMIANGVHWFNPLVYAFNRDVETLCERSCDERLVAGLDRAGRKFYGETILSMLAFGVAQKSGLYTSFCGSKKKIKRRLLVMLEFRKTRISLSALSIIVAAIVAGFGGTMAFAMSAVIAQAETPWYESYREKKMIAAEEIYINGEKLAGFPAFYTHSVEIGGVFEANILIPLRAVAEKLEFPVTWDGETGTATVAGIALRAGESPEGYGSTTRQYGGHFYVQTSFFTEILGVTFDMTFGGVDTAPLGQDFLMTFSGTDHWGDFVPATGEGEAMREKELLLGYQTYNIVLAESLETGAKWVCTVNDETGVSLLKDEYLGSEMGATDEKAIHMFTFKFGPTSGRPAGTTLFTFTETPGGRQIVYKSSETPYIPE